MATCLLTTNEGRMTPMDKASEGGLGYTYMFRCTECEGVVTTNCATRPLTEKEQAELAARMLCMPCLNKKIGKK